MFNKQIDEEIEKRLAKQFKCLSLKRFCLTLKNLNLLTLCSTSFKRVEHCNAEFETTISYYDNEGEGVKHWTHYE